MRVWVYGKSSIGFVRAASGLVFGAACDRPMALATKMESRCERCSDHAVENPVRMVPPKRARSDDREQGGETHRHIVRASVWLMEVSMTSRGVTAGSLRKFSRVVADDRVVHRVRMATAPPAR